VVVARVTVTEVILSVPDEVLRVKVSDVVADPPGASDTDGVSVPVPSVTVVDPGITGFCGRSTPVDQLPVVSWV
jgi:hypothetical protein